MRRVIPVRRKPLVTEVVTPEPVGPQSSVAPLVIAGLLIIALIAGLAWWLTNRDKESELTKAARECAVVDASIVRQPGVDYHFKDTQAKQLGCMMEKTGFTADQIATASANKLEGRMLRDNILVSHSGDQAKGVVMLDTKRKQIVEY